MYSCLSRHMKQQMFSYPAAVFLESALHKIDFHSTIIGLGMLLVCSVVVLWVYGLFCMNQYPQLINFSSERFSKQM